MKITTIICSLLLALMFGAGCGIQNVKGIIIEPVFEYQKDGYTVSTTTQVNRGSIRVKGYPTAAIEVANFRILTPVRDQNGNVTWVRLPDGSYGYEAVVDSLIYHSGGRRHEVGTLRSGESCNNIYTSIGEHTLVADVWLVQNGRRGEQLPSVNIPFVVDPGYRDWGAAPNSQCVVDVYPPSIRY